MTASIIKLTWFAPPHPVHRHQSSIIEERPSSVLSGMRMVTIATIMQIVSCSPAKHCSLDLVHAWRHMAAVKRALPLLADTIASMCNASIPEGVFSDVLTHAIVQPRLKKPTLDPAEPSSYRPISNLIFISKTIERVVAARFSVHVEAELASVAISSYSWPIIPISTEMCNIDSGKVSVLIYCSISAHSSKRSITKHCWKFLVGVSASWERCWTGLILTWQIRQSFQQGVQQSEPYRVNCLVPQNARGPATENDRLPNLRVQVCGTRSWFILPPSL